MDVDLAVVIQQHPTELDKEHSLRVLIQTADGKRIAEAEVTWQSGPMASPPLREIPFPLVLPLHKVMLPDYGEYSIELLIDNVHQTSLPLTVSDRLMEGRTPRLG